MVRLRRPCLTGFLALLLRVVGCGGARVLMPTLLENGLSNRAKMGR
jgi:hypothetical protein